MSICALKDLIALSIQKILLHVQLIHIKVPKVNKLVLIAQLDMSATELEGQE